MAGRLHDILCADAARPRVVDTTVRVVEGEVARKRGVSGIAIRTVYGAVRAVRPDFVHSAVSFLLPEFVAALEPFYASYAQSGGGAFDAFLLARRGEVARALLGVTDARAQRTQMLPLKKAYAKLRPLAQAQVEEAVPELARAIAPFVPRPGDGTS